MSNPGVNYVSDELTKLVKTGQYLGGINAGLIQRTVWAKGGKPKPAPVRDGDDFKINESEPSSAKQDPSSPVNPDSTSITDILYSGVSVRQQKHGHYVMYMNKWRDLTSVSVDDAATAFTDTVMGKMDWIAGSAGLTRDLQCRRILNQAYQSGRSYVTTASGSSVTSLDVKDCTGFQQVREAGVPFDVSSSHPLSVTITNGVVGTVTKNVTGCTPGTRVDADDTTPGSITISVAIAQIAVGDPVISSQEAVSVRPNGRTTSYNLLSTDKLTFAMITRIAATMKDFGIMPHADGMYHFIGDTDHFFDLWQDDQFARAYQGQYSSAEWREGNAIVVAGILFDFSNQPANSLNEAGVLVKRFMVTGEGHLDLGYYDKDPKQTYIDVTSTPQHLTTFDAENKVKHIVHLPVNVFADTFHMAWEAYWGFAARTDSLAAFGKYPLASVKRGVAGQTG